MTRQLISKFPGRCKRCGGRIAVGQPIEWSREGGATHVSEETCARFAPTEQTAAKPQSVPLDLTPIIQMLQAAKARGLRFPKARFLAPKGGELKLSLAGEQSKNPGAMYVKRDSEYLGLVTLTGEARGALAAEPELQELLMQIATDPVRFAREYGKLTCRCSFCGLRLEDVGSVEAGYGPICARNWALPHVALGVPTLKPIPRVDPDATYEAPEES